MLLFVDTGGLYERVYVDGRHTAGRQWETVAAEVARLTRRRSNPADIVGAYLITDNPNRRPYFRPGQKIRR